MVDPKTLIDDYLDESIDEASFETLCQWLEKGEANQLVFIKRIALHNTISEWSAERSGRSLPLAMSGVAEAEDVGETASWMDAFVDQDDEASTRKRDASKPGALTCRQIASLTGYALGLALTSKLAYKAYGIAAAILVAATLFIVLNDGDDAPTTDPLAHETHAADTLPNEPSDPAPMLVATLTAQQGAAWSTPAGVTAPMAGDLLFADQRLTLTRGFAEITTNRGAIAILEAPATVEFTHHDNAIRLHTGKLVGICETESSKGFLVYTPHMQITDLGTRLGVQANAEATEVHVFEGEVRAEKVDAGPDSEPTLLTAHQSARASADTDTITRVDYTQDALAAMLPRTIELPGTGVGLNVGDTDPNWQIVAVDGRPLDTPQALLISGNEPYVTTVPNAPARSQWIAWDPQIKQDHVCTLRTNITIPNEIDPDTARIDLRFYADAQVRAIVVNGQRNVLEVGPVTFGTWQEDHARISEHLQAGINEIEFEIANLQPNPGKGAGLVGLKLEWQLIGKADWKQAQ